jgi:hypothetical protein
MQTCQWSQATPKRKRKKAKITKCAAGAATHPMCHWSLLCRCASESIVSLRQRAYCVAAPVSYCVTNSKFQHTYPNLPVAAGDKKKKKQPCKSPNARLVQRLT